MFKERKKGRETDVMSGAKKREKGERERMKRSIDGYYFKGMKLTSYLLVVVP